MTVLGYGLGQRVSIFVGMNIPTGVASQGASIEADSRVSAHGSNGSLGEVKRGNASGVALEMELVEEKRQW